MVRKAMLIDESRCTACRGCQVACKQWNDLEGWEYSKTVNRGSYENPPRLSPQTWTRIKFNEYEGADGFRWLFLKEGCMHCGDPACVHSCPTAALKQQPDGRVTVGTRSVQRLRLLHPVLSFQCAPIGSLQSPYRPRQDIQVPFLPGPYGQ